MSKSELSTGREAGNVKHGDQDQMTFVQMQEQIRRMDRELQQVN